MRCWIGLKKRTVATSLLKGAGVQEKLSIGKVGHNNACKQNCKFALILYKKKQCYKQKWCRLCSWIKLFLTILNLIRVRSSRPEVFCEKGVLRNFAKFTGKNLCQSNFFKKETLAQVFSSEFCEIPKNTFSYRIHPLAACVGLDALTSAQEDAWPLRTTHWYLPLKTLSANLNLFNTRKNEKTRYF